MEEKLMTEQEQQEIAKAKQEIMQDIAEQIGAEYEVDDQGNDVAVRMSIDEFHNLLEMLADASMKMGMLEALFEAAQEEGEEEEEDDEDDECCDDDDECCDDDEECEDEGPLGRRKK